MRHALVVVVGGWVGGGQGITLWVKVLDISSLCSGIISLHDWCSPVLLLCYTLSVEKVETQPQYSKARPVLPAGSLTRETSNVIWHAGSSGILCVVVNGGRETRSEWSYNGSHLNSTEVSIATEDCVDCREECIQEAERKAGLDPTHHPVAIVGKWETPCFGVAPTTINLMSFVRVPNATLRDSGDYAVKFMRRGAVEFSHSYDVTVGEIFCLSLCA